VTQRFHFEPAEVAMISLNVLCRPVTPLASAVSVSVSAVQSCEVT
jgi:hypothetical protein